MKLKYHSIGLILLILFLAGCSNNTANPTGNAIADLTDNPEKVTIYFFWGDGCPHCETQKPFLESLEQKYGDKIEIKRFETWKNPENVVIFQEVAKSYGTTARGVPATFIGELHWVGYADYMGSEMENQVKNCIENGCINPGDKLK